MRVQEREWERVATLGTWVLMPHKKKGGPALTARKLLGRSPQIWPMADDDGDR